jgi:hypothetical protein
LSVEPCEQVGTSWVNAPKHECRTDVTYIHKLGLGEPSSLRMLDRRLCPWRRPTSGVGYLDAFTL